MRTPDQRRLEHPGRPARPLRARAGRKARIGRTVRRLHQLVLENLDTSLQAASRGDTYGRAQATSMRGQRQFPVLPDQIAAKAVMRLLARQAKPGGLVNAARRDQYVVCPQCELAIARSAREADTLPYEPASNPEPASLWLNQKQAQFANFFAVPDEEYRADDFAVTLGDPAALPPGI